MPGGGAMTNGGLGADASRNVWAGILSVRLSLLLVAHTHPLITTRTSDPLRSLWWYPLWL